MRVLHYLFRRRLGMSVAESDALPWWEWRLLVEGLDEEARANAGEPPRQAPPADAADEHARLAHRGVNIRQARQQHSGAEGVGRAG